MIADASSSLVGATPRQRIEALADPGSVAPVDAALEAPRASPHLARWAIRPQDDDGIVTARGSVHGAPVWFAAQDARFLGGSVGVEHARALRALFAAAMRERPAAIVLLLASGGVRLHEATPAEAELAHALSMLFDGRAAGVAVIGLAVGDVFGGASVVACACDRTGMLPGTRLGVSGPKVIASAASAPIERTDVFGAASRNAAGQVDLVVDAADAVRGWVAAAIRGTTGFETSLRDRHDALRRRLDVTPKAAASLPQAWRAHAALVDERAGLWRANDANAWIAAPRGDTSLGPAELHALDDALLTQVLPHAQAAPKLVLLEDSAGHEVSYAAESALLSCYLAHHAAVLARLRMAGVHVLGVLAGTGHSAAFFAHALQAPRLYAVTGGRVMAMGTEVAAQVTGRAREAFPPDDDPALGHDVAALAQSRTLEGEFQELDAAALRALLSAP